ncbi:MAG: type II toxin-antitoxin system HicB family antitoxin [Firmicutes bacterium]|nr:type II toxin-antitoxin system HicB family antitoxin [Bacillota bacterium]
MTTKNIDYYMNLEYPVVFYPAKEGGYVIEIPDLPGCITQGDEMPDAVKMIQDAKRAWIEARLEDGLPIPEPGDRDNFSGKFNVRVPKSLHKALVEGAKRENVSLNQYIIYQLSKNLGHKRYD